MTLINSYATLADYKAYVTARGQVAGTDTTDDGVIQDLLNSASRFIDIESGRKFYPRIEEQMFDIPEGSQIYLDDDLLEVLTFSNGDDTAITAYILLGKHSPYWCIQLRDYSTISWQTNSDGSYQQVIGVLGVWGYHDQYSQRAWLQVGTLGAAITDTTTLAFTMTGGHTVVAGNILKIGSELYNVETVATNTITPSRRGDNGSTAATHLISTAVYAWQPMEGARMACLEIANSAYKRRFGQSTGESATITGAGVVLTPRDIPATAQSFINSMRPLV